MTNNPPAGITRSWNARLDLVFAHRNKKTVLAKKQHIGPLVVQKPFYPENKKCCHIYIIHPPAGIVGGDSLTMNASLSSNTHALVTTPAATKFYKSNGYSAIQNQNIILSENSIFEWLPQETIYFNGTQAENSTRINIAENSKFIAWEIQCLGQPSTREEFNNGICIQKFEIWKHGQPLLLECNRIQGGEKILSSPWGLNNYRALGSMVFNNPDELNVLAVLKDRINTSNAITAGYTHFNGLAVVRATAHYAEQIKELFVHIWKLIRPYMLQREACLPRIWQT